MLPETDSMHRLMGIWPTTVNMVNSVDLLLRLALHREAFSVQNMKDEGKHCQPLACLHDANTRN